MVDWLTDWLTDCMTDWLTAWLTDLMTKLPLSHWQRGLQVPADTTQRSDNLRNVASKNIISFNFKLLSENKPHFLI